ncbi:MAG TPA: L,D-transpeptidase family protein [Burkholderiales bacterium]|nr:L,D-transpeptidase family protein [Burkholderiales bacterium]
MNHRLAALLFIALWGHAVFAANDISVARAVVGGEFDYVVRKGDTLTSIGARFGVSEKNLARENRLVQPYRLRPGNQLKVSNLHVVPGELSDGVLINIPQRMLFFFRDAKVVSAYPVALGRHDWQTPTGEFFIRSREKDKTWLVPPSIQEEMRLAGKPILTRVPPGPDNPLGGYWMGLSLVGYGMHGTNVPASIYRMRTHGCIRLHPDDAEALYGQVSLNMPVKIIYAPVLVAALTDRPILVEVNPDVYNRGIDALGHLREIARAQGLEQHIDWTMAARVAREKDGVARPAGDAVPGREAGSNERTIARNERESTTVYPVGRLARAGGGCFAAGPR